MHLHKHLQQQLLRHLRRQLLRHLRRQLLQMLDLLMRQKWRSSNLLPRSSSVQMLCRSSTNLAVCRKLHNLQAVPCNLAVMRLLLLPIQYV